MANKFDKILGMYREADSGGSGDVVGPASATDGHFAVFDGITGKKIKDGGSAVQAFDGGAFSDTFYDTVDFDAGAF